MKKILLFVLVMALTVVMFSACGGNNNSTTDPKANVTTAPDVEANAADNSVTVEKLKEKGEFVVGLDDTFAPMGFRDPSGELVGFDIDLANAVGEKLGVTVRFQPISWDAKEMELSTGQIDCIWNGLSITPSREEQLSLSKAYLANYIVIMTKEGVTISTKEDLANYQIGIQSASAALEAVMADDIYESISANITEYPTYDEVILDIQAGRLDCMVIDQVFGEYKNTQLGGIYSTVESFNFGEDLYAIGFRKADTSLTNSVNDALAELVKDGTAKEISEKWFGEDLVLK